MYFGQSEQVNFVFRCGLNDLVMFFVSGNRGEAVYVGKTISEDRRLFVAIHISPWTIDCITSAAV
jgi:hypothetical protein